MNPKQAAAIITGTIARPSNPSVRLTAFDAPTMTKMAKGMKNQPRLRRRFLKKGTDRLAASGSRVSDRIHIAARAAIPTSSNSFNRPGRPLEFIFDSFR